MKSYPMQLLTNLIKCVHKTLRQPALSDQQLHYNTFRPSLSLGPRVRIIPIVLVMHTQSKDLV